METLDVTSPRPRSHSMPSRPKETQNNTKQKSLVQSRRKTNPGLDINSNKKIVPPVITVSPAQMDNEAANFSNTRHSHTSPKQLLPSTGNLTSRRRSDFHLKAENTGAKMRRHSIGGGEKKEVDFQQVDIAYLNYIKQDFKFESKPMPTGSKELQTVLIHMQSHQI